MYFTILVVILLGFAWATGAAAEERSEQSLVTIKTYIFSASSGQDPLSFPMFPHMSMAVLEETIADAEAFSGKLKSLYAFSQYALLDRSTVQVRLSGYPGSVVGQSRKKKAEKTGPWAVAIDDFAWDREGRLQMMVKITHETKSFLESHVSVKPSRSVVLGRFADEQMGEAVFVVVAPVVEVEVAPKLGARESDATRSIEFGMKKSAGAMQKKGLPPPEPEVQESSFPCPTDAEPDINDFVAVAKMPEIVDEHTPAYPEAAQRAGTEGSVWIKSLISKEGTVLKCCIVSSSGREDLDRAAFEAAQKNTYIPAQDENGKPVSIWIAFRVTFALENK
ncbi:energy transducer TonB [Candidatus Zixiibacteriota bacterium]